MIAALPPTIPLDPFWVSFVAKTAATLTGLATIYKVVYRPFKKQIIDKGVYSFHEFMGKVNYITNELKPNGGNSLRDQVDYIRKVTEKVELKQVNFLQMEPHGIYEMDDKGKCIWMNRAYLDIVRCHPDDVFDQGWRNFIAINERDRMVQLWEQAIRDARDFFCKTKMVDSTGNEIPVEIRSLVLRNSKGVLLGYLGFVTRLDRAPVGCRWCSDTVSMAAEVAKVLEERRIFVLARDAKADRIAGDI